MNPAALLARIQDRSAVVGIVGMGYVGLPLSITFVNKGFSVIGLDVDATKVTALNDGKSYIRHIPHEAVAGLHKQNRFTATSDMTRAKDCDAVIICVPTPLTAHRDPDMSYITSTAKALAPHLKAGHLIVLESTTYPGTTDELLRDELERGSPLRAGRDFMLAYSPEREDPGNPNFTTQRIPKVVGGCDEVSGTAAVALYGAVLDKVVPVSSARAAEMTKLLENIFRNVNIALVNELKMLCHRMGIDVWEVIGAASTKPFGFMPFYPGPGLGGHCIPVDPFYLTWKAREFEMSTRFIELAGEINSSMPRYVIERVSLALNERHKSLKGAEVLVLGVAYKRDVDDMRESPSLRILSLLQERGAKVSYHDPYIPRLVPDHDHRHDMTSRELSDETLRKSDCVLIITDHSAVDYQRVVSLAPLVVDTRNATAKLRPTPPHVVHA